VLRENIIDHNAQLEGGILDNVMVGEVPNTNLLHQKTYIKLKHHYTLHDDLVARGREVRMPESA